MWAGQGKRTIKRIKIRLKVEACKNISLSSNKDLKTLANKEAKLIFMLLLLINLNIFCLFLLFLWFVLLFSFAFVFLFFFLLTVIIIFLNRNRAVADTLCSTHSESWHDSRLFLLKSWLIVYIY